MATSYAEMAFDANAFNPLTYSGRPYLKITVTVEVPDDLSPSNVVF